MINTDRLRGIIAERGLRLNKLAREIGMHESTMYAKMHRGVFDSDEIEKMIDILEIESPLDIFFAKK